MAEAFVRTIKRDYVRVSPRPDAETVMRQLPGWIAHYNKVHPHKALGYRSPCGASQLAIVRDTCPVIRGLQHPAGKFHPPVLQGQAKHQQRRQKSGQVHTPNALPGGEGMWYLACAAPQNITRC